MILSADESEQLSHPLEVTPNPAQYVIFTQHLFGEAPPQTGRTCGAMMPVGWSPLSVPCAPHQNVAAANGAQRYVNNLCFSGFPFLVCAEFRCIGINIGPEIAKNNQWFGLACIFKSDTGLGAVLGAEIFVFSEFAESDQLG